ncbi:MAG TPA: hypothetical protein VIM12_14325 [Noviherbaspirillum sp.]|jgi:2-keto-3-deoxy-L-rhamnonate aldolase RhmA|uniref:hypothetical protein n=1 Tax=Noviherbaspirillum sp. TaxID=1926288 RepID=UPI002F91D212
MPTPNLKQQLDAGGFLLGTWSQSASPEMLEILGYSGFDFTIIDTEHGFFGLETAENLVRPAEATPVRYSPSWATARARSHRCGNRAQSEPLLVPL